MPDDAPTPRESALRIRAATADDWPAIWSIFSAVVATGDTYMYPPDTPEADARRTWTGPGLWTYVAEADGEIVGTYAMRVNQPGHGSHVVNAGYMVRPHAFGRGVGGAMCAHSLGEARTLGFRAMQFNAVVSTNARAVALWQRMGFAIVGTVPRAFRHATLGEVDLHIMHRFL